MVAGQRRMAAKPFRVGVVGDGLVRGQDRVPNTQCDAPLRYNYSIALGLNRPLPRPSGLPSDRLHLTVTSPAAHIGDQPLECRLRLQQGLCRMEVLQTTAEVICDIPRFLFDEKIQEPQCVGGKPRTEFDGIESIDSNMRLRCRFDMTSQDHKSLRKCITRRHAYHGYGMRQLRREELAQQRPMISYKRVNAVRPILRTIISGSFERATQSLCYLQLTRRRKRMHCRGQTFPGEEITRFQGGDGQQGYIRICVPPEIPIMMSHIKEWLLDGRDQRSIQSR